MRAYLRNSGSGRKNEAMSVQMSVARTYLRLFRKPGDRKSDYVKQQQQNAPFPQAKIAAKHEVAEFHIGSARGVWLRNANSRGVIVYLHGGSFITGPHAEQWEWLSAITTATRTDAVVIDYRLAPQHPFPLGFDDALMITRSLLDDGTLGSRPWVLAGDSAGGGMALAVAHALRDEGRAQPRGLFLMSPWVDLRADRTYPNDKQDPWLTPIGAVNASRVYAGSYDQSNVALSPLVNNHVGLTTTYIEEAGDDILVNEGRELASALQAAGVQLSYNERPGCFHDYPLVGWLPESKQARAREVEWINSVLGWSLNFGEGGD
jgi:acetyl esterase/lipase